MTAFQIWWIGYPPALLFNWYVCGKLAEKHWVLGMPNVRAAIACVCAIFWPIELAFDILPSGAVFVYRVARDFVKKVVIGNITAREWWINTEFGVTVNGDEE